MKIKRLFCLLLVMILLVTSISILPADKKISAKENSYTVHVYNTLGNLGSGNETVAELIARGEKNDKEFVYTSKEMNIEYDTITADSVESAKEKIEKMLIEHWNGEIECLEDRLRTFKER